MKTIQLGMLLFGTIISLSACNNPNKKGDETKSVTRISYARGFDMQSARMDSPVIYDEQGRVTQIDFIENIIYEDNKVTAIYKPGNVQSILHNELILENGKPVSIYTEFRDPADSTSFEVYRIDKGTFHQNGDTLFLEESSYKPSSDEVVQKVYTQWITDDMGYMTHRNIRNIRGEKEERAFLSTCFYDKAHACPDIATAYFVSLMGSADLLLLVSGNQPGLVKAMPLRFELEGAPFSALDFVNEYNADGYCVRAVYKAGNDTLSNIQLEYETVAVK